MSNQDPTATRLNEMSPAKRALLERWKRGGTEPSARATIARTDAAVTGAPREAPVSSTQLRSWYLDQVVPGSPAYNASFAFRFVGSLDRTALARALTEIVRRHETLRTTFPSVGGRTKQVIGVPFQVDVPFEDLAAIDAPQRAARMAQAKEAEARRILSLERGPLFATRLLRLAQDEHVFLFTIHHIMFDGWSFGVLNRELVALYGAYAEGKPSALPELPIQYADFATWQQKKIADRGYQADLDFWKRELEGLPTLSLPTDRPRPAVQTFRGARMEIAVPKLLVVAVREACQREDVTPYMFFLGAFTALLSRYSGQDDVVVGSPIANRSPVETEGLIGFFANTVASRTDLSGDPSFRALLGRIRPRTLEALQHQGLPFEQLVNELSPERDLSRNPLFQVMMVLQHAGLGLLPLRGLACSVEELHSRTAKFDIWLQLLLLGDTWTATFEYSTDLFDEVTIARMARHLLKVLESVTENPELCLSAIPLLDEEERRRVVVEFNDTAKDYGPDRLLHEHIEAQVARTPDAVAVSFEGQTLTYAQLDARANQLAHLLVAAGVTPDTLVGVYAERSANLVVALLAVLKSGGAYVPVDPTYPADRVEHMLRDANPAVLLTDRGLPLELGARFEGLRQVRVDDALEGYPTHRPDVAMPPSRLAYMIYTSGSTGLPKGAMNSHRGICNRLLWMQDAYGLTPNDRVLQKTPFSFDVSVWEFFWPLMTGARLVMARPEGHKDPAYLTETIVREGITTIHFVPSMLQAILDHPDMTECTSLVRVICSGEALPAEYRDRFFGKLPSAELHNLYGPTEAAVDVTFWQCKREDTSPTVPIGRPIANTQIYILDTHGQPTPVGVPGELTIGGTNVGRGYLNRPELDAERFVRDPFRADAAKMYRTGDRARFRGDGVIEFLGRLDDQVKIRGFRIELGEIESALRRQPTIKDAVVTGREEDGGRKRLVAYVVPEDDAAASAGVQLEHVSTWETVYDDTYRPPGAGRAANIDEDFSGWNSSFTGKQLPAEAMQEWVDTTVARIRALNPARILELGAGTGLFLFRLAPHCEAYHATDISKVAIEELRQEVSARGLSHVALEQKEAIELDGPPGAYDVIVLNSVVQYFPSLQYLSGVLERAQRLLRPGGAIFIGDVRSLPLLELFHTSLELTKAPAKRPCDQLRRRVRHAMLTENELVIHPAFFRTSNADGPLVCERILSKRGRYQNELNQFRYDVILRHAPAGADPLAWQKDAAPDTVPTLEDVRRHLTSERPSELVLRHLRDARLVREVRALELVADASEGTTAGQLRKALAEDGPGHTGVAPESVFALGDELGYDVDVTPCDEAPGFFDARFLRPDEPRTTRTNAAETRRPGEELSTQPLRQRLSAALVPVWRQALKQGLPDFMIPSAFVLLDAIPIGAHGKVHRAVLPAPAPTLSEIEVPYVAPRTKVEETLAGIWAEVLGLESVGMNNNFFALGGDSIHSIQAIARARKHGLNLTVEQLFRNQTITELAAVLNADLDAEPPKSIPVPESRRAPKDLAESVDLPDTTDAVDVYPVAPMQAYMIDQLVNHPQVGLYVLFTIFPMRGTLDVPALGRAWQSVIDRHPGLRTSFSKSHSGRYVQVVHEQARLEMEAHDWRQIPEGELESSLRSYIQATRARGFALDECPQMRAAVFRTDDEHHWCVFAFNYLQRDGWSTVVVFRELMAFYHAYSTGSAVPVLENPPPPRAHIERVRAHDARATEAFWRSKLSGIVRPTPLVESIGGVEPGTEPEPAFSRQHVVFGRAITERLDALSREERLTLSTFIHGAWSLLLAHYTKTQDVLYGAIVSARSAEISGVEDMVGLFNNVLAIRPPSAARFETLRDWLHTAQEDFLELRRYEHTCLSDTKQWSELPKEEARLFQSYIAIENIPGFAAMVAEMDLRPSPTTEMLARIAAIQLDFPLRVEVFPGQQLVIVLHYYRRYFRDDVITGILRDLERAIAFMLDGLDQPPRFPHH
ncbi:amino acid adenylation domain-containing protein [Pendulispora rubella]|uniref:Amino acid adenylation domain-containing protein n=1 Tax=Pendulispora rubella TaxID=2741070 RepID=A0ABZ2LJR0_9BACT